MQAAPADTASLKAQIDLRVLVEKELGRPRARTQRYWTWHCCFHKERGPSLQVWPDGYKCFGCGAYGDVITWIRQRGNVTFQQAIELLGGNTMRTSTYTPSRYVPHAVEKQPPASEWQERVMAAWPALSRNLYHTSQGDKAYRWLEARGLHYHTIDDYDLGFCIGDHVDPHGRRYAMINGLKVWHGITIRHTVGSQVWAVQVRVPTRERYICVPGSVKGALFGADALKGKDIAIIVEGEFDTMLGNQLATGLPVGFATLGSASDNSESNIKAPHVVSSLFGSKRILIATDSDAAGEEAAKRWQFTKRAVRYPVPPGCGKDIGEYYTLAGAATVCRWIEEGMQR